MARLSVGFNWDFQLLDRLLALEGPNQIASVYCSLPYFLESARPDSRIPFANLDQLEQLADRIPIHYCLNSPRAVVDEALFRGRIGQLVAKGVHTFIVAHPQVAQWIEEDTSATIIWSTIMEVADLRTVFRLAQKTPTQGICPSIYMNRSTSFLRGFYSVCETTGIMGELLANEFCTLADGPCHMRASCYDLHASNRRVPAGGYPMRLCIESRRSTPSSWIRAPFILPQWIGRGPYADGFTYKITGRTHSSDFIYRTAKAYVEGQYTGNLCDLWGPLEKIWGDVPILPYLAASVVDGFFEKLLDHGERCSRRTCADCSFCDTVAQVAQDVHFQNLGEQ